MAAVFKERSQWITSQQDLESSMNFTQAFSTATYAQFGALAAKLVQKGVFTREDSLSLPGEARHRLAALPEDAPPSARLVYEITVDILDAIQGHTGL